MLIGIKAPVAGVILQLVTRSEQKSCYQSPSALKSVKRSPMCPAGILQKRIKNQYVLIGNNLGESIKRYCFLVFSVSKTPPHLNFATLSSSFLSNSAFSSHPVRINLMFANFLRFLFCALRRMFEVVAGEGQCRLLHHHHCRCC